MLTYYSLVLAFAVVSPFEVIVTLTDGETIGDSTPVAGADVTIRSEGKQLGDAVTTDKWGTAKFNPPQPLKDDDKIRVFKSEYKPEQRIWQDLPNKNLVHIPITPLEPKEFCKYTVQRPVYETRADGTRVCRMVYETKQVECWKAPLYHLPVTPPPDGYKYVFDHAIVRLDEQRHVYVHRPYYRLEPVCPQVTHAHTYPYSYPQYVYPVQSPCNCQ